MAVVKLTNSKPLSLSAHTEIKTIVSFSVICNNNIEISANTDKGIFSLILEFDEFKHLIEEFRRKGVV